MPDSKNVVERSDLNIRKQKRAMLTRQQLLLSARATFARDGFEHARIKDIALKAGKTRGAFYSNFKDKEDVFFAIFEQNINRDMAELNAMLCGLSDTERRVEALGNYLSELCKDRERVLLNLEFKLYAIRHARKRKRLADLYTFMCLHSSIPELAELFPRLNMSGDTSQVLDSLAIGGIMDGLALSHFFHPNVLGDVELARYLKLCLRKILECIPAQNT
jgi:AcrR family transcriptional regulator